jgi:hypothetical protein
MTRRGKGTKEHQHDDELLQRLREAGWRMGQGIPPDAALTFEIELESVIRPPG